MKVLRQCDDRLMPGMAAKVIQNGSFEAAVSFAAFSRPQPRVGDGH